MQNEIFFNELCLNNKPDDYSVLTNLKKCYQKFKSEGFSVCRLTDGTQKELLEYLTSISGVPKHTVTSFFYAFFHTPFEREDLTEEIKDKFLQHDFYYNGQQTIGLQWAYTYDTLAFSLLTDNKWDCDSIVVIEKTEPDNEIRIHHAATVTNIEIQKDWIDSLKEIVLIETTLLPEQKSFNVAGTHHGNDKRRLLWDRIRKNKYVVSCITSTENCSYENSFIHKVYNDGRIELVLYWEDSHYSMLIQTTGRNKRETTKIADILTEEYSK